MFVYQPPFNTLELKEDKGTDYVIGWKSKGVYSSKLILLYTDFLHKIKVFGYKIRIQFSKSVLVVEENNYAAKIANVCIVYDLDNWPRNPLNNFTLKIACLVLLI